MEHVISIVILLAIMVIIPPVCGLLPLRLMREEHRSLLAAYVTGWIVLFALFQMTAVPFILVKTSFHLMADCYSVLLLLVFIIGAIVGRRIVPGMLKTFLNQSQEKSRWEKAGWIAVIVLTVAQVIFLVFYQYIDGDDAYYVVVSLDSLEKDSMYMTNAYDGYPYTNVEIRHALSPVPLFVAWIAKYTMIHPTILAHSVIGPAFLGLMYLIYILLGRRLLRDHGHWVPAFVLLVMAFYIFGHVSIYTAETFAYTRTWQGKSMLPNLIIPMCYLALLYLAEEKRRFGEWLLLFMLMLAAVFCTSVSVFFMAVLLGVAGVLFWARGRRMASRGTQDSKREDHAIRYFGVKDVIGFGICLLPCLVFGILYLLH